MQTTGRWSDKAARIVFTSAAFNAILIVFLIFLFIGKESRYFFADESLASLISPNWIPTSEIDPQYGIIPLLTGSLLITFIATLIAIPFGVIGAIYLAEIARPIEREILKPFVEMLAGIPSVVIGFFGVVVVGPLIKNIFGLETGFTALTGSVLLALMAIPTILTISEDAIRNVPQSYKQASTALGATRLQTIFKVCVPASLSGIIAAVMLGIGRVIGETMTVMMVAGGSPIITANPTDGVRTLTQTIAAEMGDVVVGGAHYASLFCIGIVLLLMTFTLNVIAQRVLRKWGIGER